MQNFLKSSPLPPLTSQPSAARVQRRRNRFTCGLLVLVVSLVFVVLSLVAVSRLAQSFSRIKNAAHEAETALRAGDLDGASLSLRDARAAIIDAKSGVALVPFLRIVPWVGTQLSGLDYTLDAALKTVDVLDESLNIVRNVAEVTKDAQKLVGVTDSDVPYHELSASARASMLHALHNAYPDLLRMQVKLALAKDDLARLHTLDVSPLLANALLPFSTALEPISTAVNLLTPFAAVVPDLAGLDADHQFLLLFANNTELRPGGGFLGVYGLAVTRDGEIVGLSTDDTYSLDNRVLPGYTATPPTPLAQYLGSTTWYFRDGNWSPDFPSSTRDTLALMRQEYAAAGEPVPDVHGVLMFTPTMIGDLLTLLGPVTIDNQTFTADNVADKLEYQVEQGYAEQNIPSHQRKDIVARLTGIVVDRLLALPSSSWPELFGVLTEAFSQKQLALWSPDTTAEAVYADAGWAGQVTMGTADDVLMIVDANMAALKTDPYVDRSITYAVVPDAEGYVATASVTYHNTGGFSWKTSRYRTYTRLYAPLGSVLLSSSGSLLNDKIQNPSGTGGVVTTEDELGMTSFGAFTSIEPGATQTLTFTYRLPQTVVDALEDGSYELRVLKQLGADAHDLSVHIAFPSRVLYGAPSESEEHWNDNAYDITTVLDSDKVFTVDAK